MEHPDASSEDLNQDQAATGEGPRAPSALTQTLGVAQRALSSVRVLMSSGLHRTSAGDLSAKVFEKHASALRSYLTIRLRDVELSRRAFVAVHDELQGARVADIKKAPSRLSHLYLLARNMAEYTCLFDDDYQERSIDAVPWDAAPTGSSPDYAKALDHLRHTLSVDEFEMLELHHVRGLTYAGVAHVLGLREDDAERKVKAASAWAEMNARDIDREFGSVEQCVQDACRVLPPPADEDPIVVSTPDPVPPGTVINERYTIEAKVGGGAFGWVYRAVDVHVPGHVVALKMLHKPALSPAAREGAIRELSVIASAFHPSLVQFKDHGWFQDRLWFVMPWYQGETLQARIDETPLTVEEAIEVFEPIARALASVHRTGIRHQDIKPENIFLADVQSGLGAEGQDRLPVLMDLGVAAPEGDMAVAGTPMYFAPEVAMRFCDAESLSPVTERADVFALALSFAHSVCPPSAESLQGLDFESFVNERQESVPTFGPESSLAPVSGHLERWLSLDHERRPTAIEFANELAALRGAKKAPKKFRMAVSGAGKSQGGGRLRWLLLVGLAVAVGAVSSQLLRPTDASPVADSEHRPDVEVQTRALEARLRDAEERAGELERELGGLRSQLLFGDPSERNSTANEATDGGLPDSSP